MIKWGARVFCTSNDYFCIFPFATLVFRWWEYCSVQNTSNFKGRFMHRRRGSGKAIPRTLASLFNSKPSRMRSPCVAWMPCNVKNCATVSQPVLKACCFVACKMHIASKLLAVSVWRIVIFFMAQIPTSNATFSVLIITINTSLIVLRLQSYVCWSMLKLGSKTLNEIFIIDFGLNDETWSKWKTWINISKLKVTFAEFAVW